MDLYTHRPRLDADLIDLDDGLRLEGDDGVGCLVRNASPELRRCLELLDGRHSLPGLLNRLPDHEQFQARVLIGQLRGAGLLHDSAPPATHDVCLVGTGPVARGCAALLLHDPGIRLHLAGSQATSWGRPEAQALRERLIAHDPKLSRRIRCAAPWPSFDEDDFDLVIIAPESVHCDRALSAHLIRHAIPFLPVLAHRTRVSVGPLADYRGGACLHCADLYRADGDPSWPRVVERLSREPAQPLAGPARLASSLAATHAAWFVQGSGNALRGLTLESAHATPGLARRTWPAHPDCACCWHLAAVDMLPDADTALAA